MKTWEELTIQDNFCTVGLSLIALPARPIRILTASSSVDVALLRLLPLPCQNVDMTHWYRERDRSTVHGYDFLK